MDTGQRDFDHDYPSDGSSRNKNVQEHQSRDQIPGSASTQSQGDRCPSEDDQVGCNSRTFNNSIPASCPTHIVMEISAFSSSGIIVVKHSVVGSSATLSVLHSWLVCMAFEMWSFISGMRWTGALENIYWISNSSLA